MDREGCASKVSCLSRPIRSFIGFGFASDIAIIAVFQGYLSAQTYEEMAQVQNNRPFKHNAATAKPEKVCTVAVRY
jgi:hypothetical protein